jgi:hypothetical protein
MVVSTLLCNIETTIYSLEPVSAEGHFMDKDDMVIIRCFAADNNHIIH